MTITGHTQPQPGDQLFSVCASEVVYTVLRVHVDEAGDDLLDLQLHGDINDLITQEDLGLSSRMKCIVELPVGCFVKLKDVRYSIVRDDDELWVDLDMPGEGCHKCTCLMQVIKEVTVEWVPNEVLHHG